MTWESFVVFVLSTCKLDIYKNKNSGFPLFYELFRLAEKRDRAEKTELHYQQADNVQDYHQALALLEQLLAEGKAKDKMAKLREDTMISYLAHFWELDTVQQMLGEYGVTLKPPQAANGGQSCPIDPNKKVIGSVRVTYSGKVTSHQFESYEVVDLSSFPSDKGLYPVLLKYVAEIRSFQAFGAYFIAPMYEYGADGEIVHLLSLWQQIDNQYQLLTLLDQTQLNITAIDTLLPISDHQHLIIGESGWGDEGYTGGTLWIGLWEMPRSFTIVHTDRWEGGLDYEEELVYEITSNLNMLVKLLRREWTADGTITLDRVMRMRIVDLKELVE